MARKDDGQLQPTASERQAMGRPRRTQGRCFELAYRFFLAIEMPDGFSLIHGTVVSILRERLAHAWAELPGNRVFDGVAQGVYQRDSYYTMLSAIAERRYTRTEFLNGAIQARSYGPWHATTGAFNDVPRPQRQEGLKHGTKR
jgi:hypothetical protein